MRRMILLTTPFAIVILLLLSTVPVLAQGETAPASAEDIVLELPIRGIIIKPTANRVDLDLTVRNVSDEPHVVRLELRGVPEESTSPIQNRFRFTGEEFDDFTSLYYLRARWYDPSVGRFITKDPFAGFPWQPEDR